MTARSMTGLMRSWWSLLPGHSTTLNSVDPYGLLDMIHNRVCCPGNHYCDYYPCAQPLSQITMTHLNVKHLWINLHVPNLQTHCRHLTTCQGTRLIAQQWLLRQTSLPNLCRWYHPIFWFLSHWRLFQVAVSHQWIRSWLGIYLIWFDLFDMN